MLKKSNEVYQFIITLKFIEPLIWRRILVPSTYTFWDLHIAIQSVMGWENYHPHAFEFKLPDKRILEINSDPYDDLDDDEFDNDEFEFSSGRYLFEGRAKIAEHFNKKSKVCTYTYDFGDSWEHIIKFEKILPAQKGETYPKCTGGERACPPEDCGGPFLYDSRIESLKNPDTKEYEYAVMLFGENFDPESFDHESIVFWDPSPPNRRKRRLRKRLLKIKSKKKSI
ncbi:MAG: plasmid pRiA4b ORF-3 family protein [Ignavibacteriales bacterium]|nr:plasmid pRiA4b ORF-3 family protein [Ignavibacteriales bacterium]